MNLRQAEVFRAVMQAGSVTGAARLLGVSQPAISRTLRHTEDVLGYALFARRGGRLLPTPEAETLYTEADAGLRGMQRVADLASALGQGGGHVLRIAANPSFGAELLPQVIGSFRKRHPRTRVDITTTAHPAVVDRVVLRQAEVGLTQFSASHPGLRSQRLGSYACRVALPPGSRLAAQDEVTPADLKHHPFISYEADTSIGRAVADYLNSGTVQLQPAITVRYPMIACMFVDAGLGAAIIDPFVAITRGRRWQFDVRQLAPPLRFETWLLTRHQRPLSHAGRTFVRCLTYALNELDIA